MIDYIGYATLYIKLGFCTFSGCMYPYGCSCHPWSLIYYLCLKVTDTQSATAATRDTVESLVLAKLPYVLKHGA